VQNIKPKMGQNGPKKRMVAFSLQPRLPRWRQTYLPIKKS
jgi:hypothetical protein